MRRGCHKWRLHFTGTRPMLYGTWYNTADGMHERISRAMQLVRRRRHQSMSQSCSPVRRSNTTERITFWIFQVQYL